ncbi:MULTISPECIES: helix-turn-helix domain-containing protein [unclassified Streptomyces]|uniref:AraC-like ligand-binding domain-containing protein n=1 Tax=unclassified Streptomyces TaxID=2593676 RepID=UPI00075020D1|nr:helix-turn-helix domain-containing protein [Streptomyces sp. M1013]OMI89490.1 transcriptional regulator [Streptomyces sp. M1013]
MSQLLTTAQVADEDALDHWRGALEQALVPASVAPRCDGRFTGRIVSGTVGALRVATVEADAQRVRRTAAHVARSPEPLMAVGVQMTGRTVLAQDGREATANEGDLFVYDTSRPYVLEQPERFSIRLVHIPRRMLAVSQEQLGSVSGCAIRAEQGCAAVLRPFLVTVVASTHLYSPPAASGLAGGLVDLFTLLVAEQAEEPAAGSGPTRHHLVQRVREHIEKNLGDPALSPESVAKAHHISVRLLHRLFENEDVTVSRLIRQRRLEECARELARRSRTPSTVSAVAQRWGFVNPAHFSRVFRGAYGLSPRDWRALRLKAEAGNRPAGPRVSG